MLGIHTSNLQLCFGGEGVKTMLSSMDAVGAVLAIAAAACLVKGTDGAMLAMAQKAVPRSFAFSCIDS